MIKKCKIYIFYLYFINFNLHAKYINYKHGLHTHTFIFSNKSTIVFTAWLGLEVPWSRLTGYVTDHAYSQP